MQVSIETTSPLERRLTVGLPADRIENEVNKRLEQAARDVRLDGFRKGKVPLRVVKQRFGQGIRSEVLGKLINDSFYEAVQQENLRPAGMPHIEPKQDAEGLDFKYIAVFEVYPEIELADLSGIEVTRITADITESDMDDMIEQLRNQQATYENIEKPAATGDRVNIDYIGTKGGVEFDGGKAEGSSLVLGSGQMIPGFEDAIVGMKAGDEKVAKLKFPDEYHSEDLKGQEVEFRIKLNAVEQKVLPAVDDKFFTLFGVNEGGMEAFRKELRSNMERELKNAIQNRVKGQVIDGLLAVHKVALPKALVDNEIGAIRNQMMQQFGEYAKKIDPAAIFPDDMFREQAERRVSVGLIFAEIVKSKSLKPDTGLVRAKVDEMASVYSNPKEIADYYLHNQQVMAQIENMVLEEQVVDVIIGSAKVTEEKASYKEVVKQGQQSN